MENTGDQELILFPMALYSDRDDQFSAIVAGLDGNLYLPVDVVNLGLDDIYRERLAAGEILEGNVYFKLPRRQLADGSMSIISLCGDDSGSMLLTEPEVRLMERLI